MENFSDKRKISIIVVLLIALGLGIHFYQDSVDSKDQAGKSALYEVQKTFETENAAVPEADRVPGVALDVDAKYPKTVAALNEMIAKKSAPSGILFEAGFKLGTLYLDHGQTDKAVAVLKQIPSLAKTDFQKASGFYLLGMAQERASQFKDAESSFEQGLSRDVEGLKGELMLGIVRSHLKLNDKEKAKLYAEKLNKELPGSAAAKAAEEMIK
jgi:tetratricopeptide (TPR) repeat protein